MIRRRGRARLLEVDALLVARGWIRRSLAPGRELARSLLEVFTRAVHADDGEATRGALADGLAELAVAMQVSFPDNLCCDLDLLAADCLRRARAAADPPALVTACFEQLCRLQRLYGRDTAIRFRYVHDLVYGFDWAKWVGRDPDLRASVGPFDFAFLDHLERRADVMLGLISVDDAVYGALTDDQARNPFPFSREPAAELTLHRDLAARGLIPVAAWDPAAWPTWRRNYAALRVERAAALGLST